VAGLWEAEKLTSFHDAELAKATKEINAILSKIGKGNRDPDRTLSLVQVQDRPFLVWASYEIVGPDDDAAVIMKALGLKVRESSQRRIKK
jgi:hypothetical protein